MKRTCLSAVAAATGLALFAEPTCVSVPQSVKTAEVDFSQIAGRLRPELFSSGYGVEICSCTDEMIRDLKALRFHAVRTHDWSLMNPNERVCDWHMIFPLSHLDATNPSNYYFAATDYLLKRNRDELGVDILFRLGTSIEHSGSKVHFNALIPEDFDKVAEVFAGTVRHYNRGWANGHRWNLRNWEIWNEPDGPNTMWCLPDGDGDIRAKDGAGKRDYDERRQRRQDSFIRFFVICLKRLKAEFGDTICVGGPALCWMNKSYFTELLKACKAEGVTPDFISWHGYSDDPECVRDMIANARRVCDSSGFTKCRLVFDEWHYFSESKYGWADFRSNDPEVRGKIWSGVGSHNGIESSCFNLSVLTMFQTSELDEAYYYGCGRTGFWGVQDELCRKYKVYHGLKLFGEMMTGGCDLICSAKGEDPVGKPVLSVLAVRNKEGSRAEVLVTDYRMRAKEIELRLKGLPAGLKPVRVIVHDAAHDVAEAEPVFSDGVLMLPKRDEEAAAYLVSFAK